MDNLTKSFLEILEVINFSKLEREEHTKQFLETCLELSLLSILQSLPKEESEEVKNYLSTLDPLKFQEVAAHYFSEEKYHTQVKSAVALVLKQYLENAEKMLTGNQKEKIKGIVESLNI